MKHDPLHQFSIYIIEKINLFGFDLSYTNLTRSLIFLSLLISAFCFNFIIFHKKHNIKSTQLSFFYESFYNFITKITETNMDEKSSKQYKRLIFTIFIFILFSNLTGLFMPFLITPTSHLGVNLTIGILVFFITLFIILKKHGFKFYHAFIPYGTPLFMKPLIFILEFVTYLAKPLTLGIRLMANVMAGHIVMEVIAGFVMILGMFGFLPFLFLFVLCGFELFSLCLQAYIFALLSCIYIAQAKEH